ncbi:hypothetical protein CJF32_00005288 [Rutstroemia sp. NJR-2017a WRK4]|nr:hypothetical protein CJF32_00005288 [Rutstroemia sp. NJR-2017a WRK4]
MPMNGRPNGRFELPALAPINFNLTDGTDIPPPPDSPIEETRKPEPATTAVPSTPNPVPQITPPESVPTPATRQSEAHAAKTNGVNSTSTSTSHSQPPANNEKPTPLRLRTPSDANQHNPNSPTRPNSIRKFLSRKSLNNNYTNGNGATNTSNEDLSKMGRPDSPSSFLSTKPSIMKRKSGSWFRGFGSSSSNASKRASVMYDSKTMAQMQMPTQTSPVLQESAKVNEDRRPMGPPPPKLPELNQLKAKIADDDQGSLGGDEMFKNIS